MLEPMVCNFPRPKEQRPSSHLTTPPSASLVLSGFIKNTNIRITCTWGHLVTPAAGRSSELQVLLRGTAGLGHKWGTCREGAVGSVLAALSQGPGPLSEDSALLTPLEGSTSAFETQKP